MTGKVAMAFGAVILAAGMSSRMGRQKMLLPWASTTVLAHIVRIWQRLGAAEVVVVHNRNPEILAEMDRLEIVAAKRIENPNPERGMFSSVQLAAKWLGWGGELTHFAIVLGDQPQLREQTLHHLLQFSRANSEKICQPEWKDRAKHPVILPKSVFLELRATPARDLKEFLGRRPRALVPLDDPGLEIDLDYPQDYESARPKKMRSEE